MLLEILISLTYAQNGLKSSEIATELHNLPFLSTGEWKAIKNIFFLFLCKLFRCTWNCSRQWCVSSKVGSSYHYSNIIRPRCFSWTCLQRINKFYKTKPRKRKQNLKVNLATYQTYQAFIIRLWVFWKSNGFLKE